MSVQTFIAPLAICNGFVTVGCVRSSQPYLRYAFEAFDRSFLIRC